MAALINNDKIKYEGAKEELRRIFGELKMFKEECSAFLGIFVATSVRVFYFFSNEIG